MYCTNVPLHFQEITLKETKIWSTNQNMNITTDKHIFSAVSKDMLMLKKKSA
jgi:hypothetical protein